MGAKLGILLILLGLGALGAALWLRRQNAPLEEPADPGRTPNPSRTPWTVVSEPLPSREEMAREIERLALYRRLYRVVLPATGALLIGTGIVLALGRGRERSSPG